MIYTDLAVIVVSLAVRSTMNTSVQRAHILTLCVFIAIHLRNLTVGAVELPKPHVDYIQAMITQFMSSKGKILSHLIGSITMIERSW